MTSYLNVTRIGHVGDIYIYIFFFFFKPQKVMVGDSLRWFPKKIHQPLPGTNSSLGLLFTSAASRRSVADVTTPCQLKGPLGEMQVACRHLHVFGRPCKLPVKKTGPLERDQRWRGGFDLVNAGCSYIYIYTYSTNRYVDY